MTDPIPQIIATYIHREKNLFFVSLINASRKDVEAKVEKQYSRARSAHKKIKNGDVEIHSGFIFALINTNFTGWECTIEDQTFPSSVVATIYKDKIIDEMIGDGFKYVGSDITRIKGVIGNGKTPNNWSKKFNVERMKKSDILHKCEWMFTSADFNIDQSDVNSVYLAIVCPDTHGARMKNFGSYQVDSISKIFLFIRNLKGLDLND